MKRRHEVKTDSPFTRPSFGLSLPFGGPCSRVRLVPAGHSHGQVAGPGQLGIQGEAGVPQPVWVSTAGLGSSGGRREVGSRPGRHHQWRIARPGGLIASAPVRDPSQCREGFPLEQPDQYLAVDASLHCGACIVSSLLRQAMPL